MSTNEKGCNTSNDYHSSSNSDDYGPSWGSRVSVGEGIIKFNVGCSLNCACLICLKKNDGSLNIYGFVLVVTCKVLIAIQEDIPVIHLARTGEYYFSIVCALWPFEGKGDVNVDTVA